jgi:organic radical activating enzyme
MRSFRVNEIFYSLQGEGRNTGRAAVFVRFAGCNLKCSFCDTDFESYREMTAEEIISLMNDYPTRFAVLTGGEPTLQVDEALVDLLHQHGYEVAMESNGTRPAPRNLDWLTVSPKRTGVNPSKKWNAQWREPDEIKVVFEENTRPEDVLQSFSSLSCRDKESILLYLQPCDTGNKERNVVIMKQCVDYVKEHPQWRLSLQTHKLIGIQ